MGWLDKPLGACTLYRHVLSQKSTAVSNMIALAVMISTTLLISADDPCQHLLE